MLDSIPAGTYQDYRKTTSDQNFEGKFVVCRVHLREVEKISSKSVTINFSPMDAMLI